MSDQEGTHKKGDLTDLLSLGQMDHAPPPDAIESLDPSTSTPTDFESDTIEPLVDSEPLETINLEPPPQPPQPTPEALESAPPTSDPIEPLLATKQLSESAIENRASATPSDPFTLSFRGFLPPYEREKLLDLITKEKMGFHPADLTPMLESGNVILPQISEYAAVLIVQAIKSAPVQIQVSPTEFFEHPPAELAVSDHTLLTTPELELNEQIPVSVGEPVPSDSKAPFQVLDALVASTTLSTHAVEAESSEAFTQALETLKTQLQFKAKRLGAQALIHFQTDLQSVGLPSHYRLTALATAIRFTEK